MTYDLYSACMHTDTLAHSGQTCLNKYVNCLDGKGKRGSHSMCQKRWAEN